MSNKISKTAAIKQARKEVNVSTTWNESMQAWFQNGKVFNRSELKNARIAYALKLLGVDSYDAEQMAREAYGMSFVAAVYHFA